MSAARHAPASTGHSSNGDGGEGSPKILFERRKRTILHNNDINLDDDEEKVSPTKKTWSKVKGRTTTIVLLASRVSGGLEMGKRLWQSPTRRVELIQILKSHRRAVRIVVLILIAIPFILHPSRLWKWSYHYFGRHNIHGGAYGRRFEYLVNKWTWEETQRQEQIRLAQLGVVLPESVRQEKYIPHLIQTHAALREVLVRRHARGNTLVALENAANNNFCTHPPPTSSTTSRRPGNTSSIDNGCGIPQVLFVPDLVSWNPPRPGKVKSFQKLLFDEEEMKSLVADAAPFLLDKWEASHSILDQIQVFALVAIYHFGGVFVGERISSLQDNIVADMIYSSTDGWFQATPSTTTKRGGGGSFGIIVVNDNSTTINTIAATPRHPLLYCALRNLEQMTLIDRDSIAASISFSSSVLQDKPSSGWTRLWGTCQAKKMSDCCKVSSESFTTDLQASDILVTERKGPTVAELYVLQQSQSMNVQSKPARPVTVKIQHDLSVRNATDRYDRTTEKVSLDLRLQSQGLQPNWLCARCIRIPTYGTIEKCARFCPKGYTDFVCHSPDEPDKAHVPLNIVVQGGGPLVSSSGTLDDRLIPRIIHQTWFEDIDLDRYPQLARLRNSWKNTGWQYRLYTDVTARKYIEDHFPSRFVEAFDVLIPGAYKADLFRYLVLLREGGTVL
jgi:hypothetical protein